MIGRILMAVAGLFLIAFLASPDSFAWLFAPMTRNGAPAIYTQTPLWSLTLSHLALVAMAVAASTLVALVLAILVTRPSGREFLPWRGPSPRSGRPFRRSRCWRWRCR